MLTELLSVFLSLSAVASSNTPAVPDWVADAIFYQIFPERFRNGDPSNDPTHDSLEFPDVVPKSWTVSPWTGDWYGRAPWEREMGSRFYDDGVFHRRYGGDLQGVLEKLDYLKDLGINAIYFNPLFHARSLHKYDGNTFHHVDPCFGPAPATDFALMAKETSDPSTWNLTAADRLLLEVVKEAHARGIRVILDGVFNHTGRDFFAFADLRRRQEESPYKDWYIVERYDDPATPKNEFRYKGWWGIDTLPEFADNADKTDLHPGPKKYIFDATARWMDPDGDGNPADGVDGWRLDVANEVPMRFWVDWNAHVRKLNPAAYTVTEIWQDASKFVKDGGFSASMNYHGFAFLVKGFLIDGSMKASEFGAQLDARRREHPSAVQLALQNLVDSHDTDRLASMIVNARRQDYVNRSRYDYDVGERVSPRNTDRYLVRKPDDRERRIQRLVALFQMAYVGAPMVYYGTETGMWGGDDPDDRMPMVWPDLKYEPQVGDPRGRPREPDPVEFDRGLHDYYKTIVALRNGHPSLRRGEFRVLATKDDGAAIAFVRASTNEATLVVLNRSDAQQTLRVPLADLRAEPGAALRPLCVSAGRAEDVSVKMDGEELSISVPALTGVVLGSPAERKL